MKLDSTVKDISVGYQHVCAVTNDNKAYCWGYNAHGRLGDGTSTNTRSPILVNGSGLIDGEGVISIKASSNHTCAITVSNKLYCWGLNNFGQLGQGDTTTQTSPVLVNVNNYNISSISLGQNLTCAVTTNNKLYCWGMNKSGQVGQGNYNTNFSPVIVNVNNKDIKSISNEYDTSCAISTENELYCWGSNSYFQLGIGSNNSNTFTPTIVDGDGKIGDNYIKMISAGRTYSCSINFDGLAYCWGSNGYRQLGDNSNDSYKSSPSLVYQNGLIDGKKVIFIDSGERFTCAITSDNKAYCWGDNTYGQIGDGTSSTARYTPTAISLPY